MKLIASLLFLSSMLYADTIPPGVVQIQDPSHNHITSTLVGGKQGLDVNIIAGGGGGSSTADQGTPASTSNAWPMILCNTGGAHCLSVNADGSLNADVTIQNSSLAVTGTFWQSTQPVSIASPIAVYPSPGATFPVAIASSVPLTISNFPSPSPTITVSVANVPTVNQGSPAPAASAWPVTIAGPSPLPISVGPVSIYPSPSATFPVSGTIGTTSPVNANASFAGVVNVTTTEGSTAAPANTVGVSFEAPNSNANQILWGVSNSSTAILSTTSGIIMEAGRSVDYLPIGTGTYLHYISSAAGTNGISIQWIKSQ